MLPHVESSFNRARIPRSGRPGCGSSCAPPGRRYLRIDGAVDNRLDPFRSTEAAAQLLAYNYHVLGTWPLALTAYNHGTDGVRHAKETLGTDDIVQHRAQLPEPHLRFRLAQFLRVVPRGARDRPQPGEVFRPAAEGPEVHFQEVELPAYVTVGALEHTLKIEPRSCAG